MADSGHWVMPLLSFLATGRCRHLAMNGVAIPIAGIDVLRFYRMITADQGVYDHGTEVVAVLSEEPTCTHRACARINTYTQYNVYRVM